MQYSPAVFNAALACGPHCRQLVYARRVSWRSPIKLGLPFLFDAGSSGHQSTAAELSVDRIEGRHEPVGAVKVAGVKQRALRRSCGQWLCSAAVQRDAQAARNSSSSV